MWSSNVHIYRMDYRLVCHLVIREGLSACMAFYDNGNYFHVYVLGRRIYHKTVIYRLWSLGYPLLESHTWHYALALFSLVRYRAMLRLQSAVMPHKGRIHGAIVATTIAATIAPCIHYMYVSRLSVCPSVCLWRCGIFFTQVGTLENNFTAE